MKGFIEVPWPKIYNNHIPMLINIEYITMVDAFLTPDGERSCITLRENAVETDLGYAEVKKLIEEAQK